MTTEKCAIIFSSGEGDLKYGLLAQHPLGKDGLPTDIQPGTDYALLHMGQVYDLLDDNYTIVRRDETRHAGAFALRFTGAHHDGHYQTIIRSRVAQ